MSSGIKELKEAIIGANKLALLAIVAARDGYQISDAIILGKALLTDADYIEAVKGAKEIAFEIKDLDGEEIAELIKTQTEFVFQFLALFGKKGGLGILQKLMPTPTPTPSSGVAIPQEGPSTP